MKELNQKMDYVDWCIVAILLALVVCFALERYARDEGLPHGVTVKWIEGHKYFARWGGGLAHAASCPCKKEKGK